MKKAFLYGMALCMAVLTSCSRDESSDLPNSNQGTPSQGNGGNTTSSVILPIQIGAISDGDVITYNGTKIVEYGNDFVKTKFTYSGDLITKIVGVGTYDLSYDNQNRLVRIKFTSAKILDNQQFLEYKFRYEGNNQVKVSFISTVHKNNIIDDSFTISNEYIYTLDNKGQVIEDRQISSTGNLADRNMYIIKYQYDDKNSPVKNIKGFDKLALAKNLNIRDENFSLKLGVINNLVSEVIETEPNEPLANKRWNYQYEYNNSGYPTKVEGFISTLHITNRKDYSNYYQYNQ